MANIIDLAGGKIGSWSIIERAGHDKWGAVMWMCKCDCGTVRCVRGVELNKGTTKSCGCKNIQKNTTHGMCKTRPYKIWQGMKTRCTNNNQPNYERYGERGIGYDPRWESFSDFWDDMKDTYAENLTLERIDNLLGYSKINCCWVTPREQNMNMRTNVLIQYNDKLLTIDDIIKITGLPRTTIYNRNARGWTGDKIVTTPKMDKYHVRRE